MRSLDSACRDPIVRKFPKHATKSSASRIAIVHILEPSDNSNNNGQRSKRESSTVAAVRRAFCDQQTSKVISEKFTHKTATDRRPTTLCDPIRWSHFQNEWAKRRQRCYWHCVALRWCLQNDGTETQHRHWLMTFNLICINIPRGISARISRACTFFYTFLINNSINFNLLLKNDVRCIAARDSGPLISFWYARRDELFSVAPCTHIFLPIIGSPRQKQIFTLNKTGKIEPRTSNDINNSPRWGWGDAKQRKVDLLSRVCPLHSARERMQMKFN